MLLFFRIKRKIFFDYNDMCGSTHCVPDALTWVENLTKLSKREKDREKTICF